MVRLAGKPILGHILDGFVESPIDDVVIIVGVMKKKVIDYVESTFGDVLNLNFVEQEQTEGLGHSIYQAREVVDDEPMCITLGDMLFDRDYSTFFEEYDALDDVDGALGVKRVDNPSNYGIVTTAGDKITELEEKPKHPDSNLAISGIYFIDTSAELFDAIEYLIENDNRGAGNEYQLTDALQRLLDEGLTLGTFQVEEWYDCGRPETLLEANRALLGTNANDSEAQHLGSSVIIPPSDIGDNVIIENSVVGPYVSVDDHAEIIDSRISDTIVGRDASLKTVNLRQSITGDESSVTGTQHQLNVGDFSEVNL